MNEEAGMNTAKYQRWLRGGRRSPAPPPESGHPPAAGHARPASRRLVSDCTVIVAASGEALLQGKPSGKLGVDEISLIISVGILISL
jgi:hypothetical protein